MILTVTLNAALDVTYAVDALVPHASHRVRSVRRRAGGKGVNVASVLHTMGVPVVATGLVGGGTGEQIRRDLDERGIVHQFAVVCGESRRTVTVVAAGSGDATVFNEPGPEVGAEEVAQVTELVAREIDAGDVGVVVVSGSLPVLAGSSPEHPYAGLVRTAHAGGATCIVDASGSDLLGALAGEPDLVKPNVAELAESTGTAGLESGITALLELGARDVLVSAGAEGATLALAEGSRLSARCREPVHGNPTGAGDAMVAAVAAGLDAGRPWRDVLADAVAWSAAAVVQPVAGEVDPADVARLRERVEVA